MKAILCTDYLSEKGLEVSDIPIPEFKEDEVLIKTAYSGVNYPDTLMIRGKYQFKPDLPFSPGQEVSGVIAQLGSEACEFKIGDRVMASMTFGGMTEYAVAKKSNTYLIQNQVSTRDGAVVLESYATAFHGLKDRAYLKAGQTLVVLGASGGTGLAAVQLGKILGCRVIAVCSTEAKREFIKNQGADITLAYENLKSNLKREGGADLIFDPVGGEMSEQAFRTLNAGGKHLVVGFASGTVPSIPWNLPLLKSADIVGVFWGGFWRANPDQNRENVKMLLKWLAEGKLTIPEPKTYPFEQASQAIEEISARRAIGKIVLKH